MIRIGVAGAAGRMGRVLIEAIANHPGAQLGAALERPGAAAIGSDAGVLAGLEAAGVLVADDIGQVIADCDVLIDFTAPVATLAHARVCAARGKAMVIGTTGFDAAQLRRKLEAGGEPRLEDIRIRFGDVVADIVAGCSDTFEDPKPPWRERKRAYIAHLADAPNSVRRVSAADKLHNARSVVQDYRTLGEGLWNRFNGGREGTLWYYRAVVVALRRSGGGPVVDELDRAVTELERIAEGGRGRV